MLSRTVVGVHVCVVRVWNLCTCALYRKNRYSLYMSSVFILSIPEYSSGKYEHSRMCGLYTGWCRPPIGSVRSVDYRNLRWWMPGLCVCMLLSSSLQYSAGSSLSDTNKINSLWTLRNFVSQWQIITQWTLASFKAVRRGRHEPLRKPCLEDVDLVPKSK